MSAPENIRYWHTVTDQDNVVNLVVGTENPASDKSELLGIENVSAFMDSEKLYTVELNVDSASILDAVGYLDLDEVMSFKSLQTYCREHDLKLAEDGYREFKIAVMQEQHELVSNSLSEIHPTRLPMTFDHYGYPDSNSRKAGAILKESLQHALVHGSADMIESLMVHDTVVRSLLDQPEEYASMIQEHPHLKTRIENGVRFRHTTDPELMRHRADCMTARLAEFPVGEEKGRQSIKKEVRAMAAGITYFQHDSVDTDTQAYVLDKLIDTALQLGMGDETEDMKLEFVDTRLTLGELCTRRLSYLNRQRDPDNAPIRRAGMDRRIFAEKMFATALSPEGRESAHYADLMVAQHVSRPRGKLDTDFHYAISDESKAILVAMDKLDDLSWEFCSDSALMTRLAEYVYEDEIAGSEWAKEAAMRLQTAESSGAEGNLIKVHELLDLDEQPAFASPGM